MYVNAVAFLMRSQLHTKSLVSRQLLAWRYAWHMLVANEHLEVGCVGFWPTVVVFFALCAASGVPLSWHKSTGGGSRPGGFRARSISALRRLVRVTRLRLPVTYTSPTSKKAWGFSTSFLTLHPAPHITLFVIACGPLDSK